MVVGDKPSISPTQARSTIPVDTRPSLENDVDDGKLRSILRILIEQRTGAEMQSGAKAMKLDDAETKEWIEEHSRGQAAERMAEIEYGTMDPDYDFEAASRFRLRYLIEMEFLWGYEKGIVSLAERNNCPLMWSHYGGQHRGMCLGYSVPARSVGDVQEVEYGGSRFVKASEVAAMLDGDDEARAMVDQSVLLRKAESWSYEQEWRLIGRRGTQNSPLELEEVIFGMRCKESGKYIVMRALEKCKGRIKFHEMREERGTFNLTKHELSYEDERFVHFPRRHLSLIEGFEAVSVRDAGMREE